MYVFGCGHAATARVGAGLREEGVRIGSEVCQAAVVWKILVWFQAFDFCILYSEYFGFWMRHGRMAREYWLCLITRNFPTTYV